MGAAEPRRALCAAVVTISTLVFPGSARPQQMPAPATAASRPPSILLVTIDTLRADRLPMYGFDQPTAPFLASLAASGTVFDDAHATSSWTVPSVVSMLTGVTPVSHGVEHGVERRGEVHQQEVIPEPLPSVAALLRDAGYRTLAVVGNAHLDEAHGFARGFDHFRCLGFADADRVNAAALEWRDLIGAADQPVLLWLHYFDPHAPYRLHEPWSSDRVGPISNRERRLTESRKPFQFRKLVSQEGERWLKLARTAYDSEIRFTDDHLAALFRELPALDRFLVVATSDHGEEFGEHGFMGHGHNLGRATVQVPLLLRPPGGDDPRRDGRVASLVDVPATLLARAGLPTPRGWDGHDLLGPPAPDRTVIARLARFEDSAHLVTLIGPRWKLVRDLRSGRDHLFDRAADPDERRDLAESRPEALAAASGRLEARLAALPLSPGAAAAPVDDETAAALAALGYLE